MADGEPTGPAFRKVSVSDIALSLVIPCFNEAANLAGLIDRCQALKVRHDVEVILVDNGSTDSTREFIAACAADATIRTVRVERNVGYGFGILSGLRTARGRFLAWTHGDLQTDPADALRALSLAEKAPQPDATFVKGSRHGRSLRDVSFTWGMSAFELLVLRVGLWDINAQPTLFSRSFYEQWRDPPHDFSLDLFAHYMARTDGLTVRRIPVTIAKRRAGVGHHDTLQGKLRLARRTIVYSLALRRRLQEERCVSG